MSNNLDTKSRAKLIQHAGLLYYYLFQKTTLHLLENKKAIRFPCYEDKVSRNLIERKNVSERGDLSLRTTLRCCDKSWL